MGRADEFVSLDGRPKVSCEKTKGFNEAILWIRALGALGGRWGGIYALYLYGNLGTFRERPLVLPGALFALPAECKRAPGIPLGLSVPSTRWLKATTLAPTTTLLFSLLSLGCLDCSRQGDCTLC